MKRKDASAQSGSAIVAMLAGVVICGALCASLVTSSVGRQKQADTEVASERAFQLAEAGIDWAIARIRIRNGLVPTADDTQVVAGEGRFTIRYSQGDANGLDDNGDGRVDDAGEHGYASIVSTGEASGVRRTVQVLMRKAVEVPSFDSAVEINVEAPILDLNGNAYMIDGREHLLDGTYDSTRPAKYGISSPATVATLRAQVPSNRVNRIIGLGGAPSLGHVAPIDLNRMVQQASASASVVITPGTHSNLTIGTPTEAGVEVAYVNGDLHLSGGASGAGVLAVDGDLTISGNFTWVGIILVRGRVTLVGGGNTKRFIGALGVGEEVGTSVSTATVGVAGTVDMLYSSDAVALAAQRLSIMAVMSWQERGNP